MNVFQYFQPGISISARRYLRSGFERYMPVCESRLRPLLCILKCNILPPEDGSATVSYGSAMENLTQGHICSDDDVSIGSSGDGLTDWLGYYYCHPVDQPDCHQREECGCCHQVDGDDHQEDDEEDCLQGASCSSCSCCCPHHDCRILLGDLLLTSWGTEALGTPTGAELLLLVAPGVLSSWGDGLPLLSLQYLSSCLCRSSCCSCSHGTLLPIPGLLALKPIVYAKGPSLLSLCQEKLWALSALVSASEGNA